MDNDKLKILTKLNSYYGHIKGVITGISMQTGVPSHVELGEKAIDELDFIWDELYDESKYFGGE